MRRRLVSVLAVLLLLITACARAPVRPVQPAAPVPSGQAAVPQEPEVKTVRVLAREFEAFWDLIIPAFQEAHPDIRVEKVAFTTFDDLIRMAKRGQVDLIPMIGSWTFGAEYQVLIDLSPFFARDRFETAPFGTLMAEETLGGKVYGLPVYAGPYILAYNKRLAQEAGVTIPADSWTWAEFRTTIAKLTRGAGNDKIYGLDWGDSSPEDLPFMQAYGLAGGPPNSAVVREVLAFWNSIVWDDHSVRRARALRSRDPLTDQCLDGQAVICLEPLSFLTSGPHAGEFRMAPLPSAPGRKPVVAAYLSSWGITYRADDKDAAWTFLRFAAGPEGQSLLARQGMFPIYASDATRKAWAESTPPPPVGAEQLFATSWWVPQHITGDPITEKIAFYEAVNGVLSGTMTLDAAVAHFDKTQ
jgi:ABC-type glycerol-3-phosphate transport system substrate-binding protein